MRHIKRANHTGVPPYLSPLPVIIWCSRDTSSPTGGSVALWAVSEEKKSHT